MNVAMEQGEPFWLDFERGVREWKACVIVDIEVSIITDVVDTDIPLLLSKDAMKRAGTCLNFEDDSVTMLKKKIPLSCTSSGHYYIPITKSLPDKRKFKHILFIKEISYRYSRFRKS